MILITGGAGYIGTHTLIELSNNNYEFIVYDNLSNSSKEAIKRVERIINKDIIFIEGDIRDSNKLKDVFTKYSISAVIHFAGLKAVGESVREPLKYYDNNVIGTIKLLEVMSEFNCNQIVFSSSATVYNELKTKNYAPLTEKDAIGETTNPYGTSKYIIERVLKDIYVSNSSFKIAILRYFNPIGAHESGSIGEVPNGIPNNLMPYISQVAVGEIEFLNIFGDDYPTHDGTGVRDYIHVSDLANAHVKAIDYLNNTAFMKEPLILNIGTGKGYSVLDMVKAFEEVSKVKIPYKVVKRREGDIAVCYANPKLAKDMLNWEATKTLEQMCEDTWRWQSNNPKGYSIKEGFKIFGFLSHNDISLYHFRLPVMLELQKRGHKVYAICQKGSKNQALRELGFEVVNYEINRASLNPMTENKTIDNIYEAIKDLKIDILQTCTAKPNIYGTFAAKRANIPIVLNLVEGLGSFYIHNNLKSIIVRNFMEFLYKKAFNQSNGCVFVNNDDPNYMLSKNLIKQDKVKIIKSVGVNMQKFSMQNYNDKQLRDIKKSLDVENKIVVLMVARAIWDKGIKEYYNTAKIIKEKYVNVEFLYVGGTDDGNPSCASIEFLQNNSVKWLGQRDDVADITAICDIYCSSSYKEGLPATLMEASAMSKPMVVTNVVGNRDVVNNGENGLLVPMKNIEELVSKIEILINDEDLRKQMGQKAYRKSIKEYEVSKIVKQYMEYYEEFINIINIYSKGKN